MSEIPENGELATSEDAPGQRIRADRSVLFTGSASWLVACILVLTAAIYSRALFNGFTTFDDDAFIVNNNFIRELSWDNIVSIFTSFQFRKYQPFVTLSYLLQYRFWGLDPLPYHLADGVLHLCSTWVVFKLIERLSGRQLSALMVAALFALHPMHVEEVAWASERKDVLYALFFFLSLLVYVRYISAGLKWQKYFFTLLLFLCSLLAKSTAMTLPLVLVAVDVYKGRKLDSRALLEKIPFLALSIFFARLSSLSFQSDDTLGHVAVANSFINRVFLDLSVPAFYIVKLFVPTGLSAMHYYPDVRNGLLPWAYYASLPFLVIVVWVLFRPGPLRKDLVFGFAFFIITISVMEQIVSVGPALTPERYTYVPYIGLFYIVAQVISSITASKLRTIALASFSLVMAVYAYGTWFRIGVWKDSETLLTDVINKNAAIADRSFLYWKRGNIRTEKGDLVAAIADYDQAVHDFPSYAEAYTNRGVAYFQSGNTVAARQDFNRALNLKPDDGRACYNRASLEAATGDFAAALQDYNKYLLLDPGNAKAYADRGMVRFNLKDYYGACEDWDKSGSMGNKEAMRLLKQYCL